MTYAPWRRDWLTTRDRWVEGRREGGREETLSLAQSDIRTLEERLAYYQRQVGGGTEGGREGGEGGRRPSLWPRVIYAPWRRDWLTTRDRGREGGREGGRREGREGGREGRGRGREGGSRLTYACWRSD